MSRDVTPNLGSNRNSDDTIVPWTNGSINSANSTPTGDPLNKHDTDTLEGSAMPNSPTHDREENNNGGDSVISIPPTNGENPISDFYANCTKRDIAWAILASRSLPFFLVAIAACSNNAVLGYRAGKRQDNLFFEIFDPFAAALLNSLINYRLIYDFIDDDCRKLRSEKGCFIKFVSAFALCVALISEVPAVALACDGDDKIHFREVVVTIIFAAAIINFISRLSATTACIKGARYVLGDTWDVWFSGKRGHLQFIQDFKRFEKVILNKLDCTQKVSSKNCISELPSAIYEILKDENIDPCHTCAEHFQFLAYKASVAFSASICMSTLAVWYALSEQGCASLDRSLPDWVPVRFHGVVPVVFIAAMVPVIFFGRAGAYSPSRILTFISGLKDVLSDYLHDTAKSKRYSVAATTVILLFAFSIFSATPFSQTATDMVRAFFPVVSVHNTSRMNFTHVNDTNATTLQSNITFMQLPVFDLIPGYRFAFQTLILPWIDTWATTVVTLINVGLFMSAINKMFDSKEMYNISFFMAGLVYVTSLKVGGMVSGRELTEQKKSEDGKTPDEKLSEAVKNSLNNPDNIIPAKDVFAARDPWAGQGWIEWARGSVARGTTSVAGLFRKPPRDRAYPNALAEPLVIN